MTKNKGRVQNRERSLPLYDPPAPQQPWHKPDPGQGERYLIDFRLSSRCRIKGWTQSDESDLRPCR